MVSEDQKIRQDNAITVSPGNKNATYYPWSQMTFLISFERFSITKQDPNEQKFDDGG